MRVLRRAAIFLGLIVVLAVGVSFIRLSATLREEARVLEWSNILIFKEIGTTARFESQAVRDKPDPNAWVVSGEIALPDSGHNETLDSYVAVVRQVCEAAREAKCWVLQSLVLGGEGPTASMASVSRGGTGEEIELAKEAVPGAETTEMVGRDLSVAEAWTPANGVANSSEPLDVKGKTLFERQTSSRVKEAARTKEGITIVIDDPKSNASAAPNAADGDVENKETAAVAVGVIDESKVDRVVYLIQDRLNRLGYATPSPLKLDGQFGARTRTAIVNYQRANGLKVDGLASRELLRHIERRVMNAAQLAELKEPAQRVKENAPTQVALVKAPSEVGIRIQLGAFRQSENAPKLWRTLQSRHSDVLRGLEHQIKRVDAGDRGIFYYLYAGPLPTESSANSVCRSLIDRQVDCLTVKP